MPIIALLVHMNNSIYVQTGSRHRSEADEIQFPCSLEMKFSCGLANTAPNLVGIFTVIQCKSIPHE